MCPLHPCSPCVHFMLAGPGLIMSTTSTCYAYADHVMSSMCTPRGTSAARGRVHNHRCLAWNNLQHAEAYVLDAAYCLAEKYTIKDLLNLARAFFGWGWGQKVVYPNWAGIPSRGRQNSRMFHINICNGMLMHAERGAVKADMHGRRTCMADNAWWAKATVKSTGVCTATTQCVISRMQALSQGCRRTKRVGKPQGGSQADMLMSQADTTPTLKSQQKRPAKSQRHTTSSIKKF